MRHVENPKYFTLIHSELLSTQMCGLFLVRRSNFVKVHQIVRTLTNFVLAVISEDTHHKSFTLQYKQTHVTTCD